MADKFLNSTGLSTLISLIKANYTDNTALATALAAKQNALTASDFDDTPQTGSTKLMKSGAIKTALDALSASLSELIQYNTLVNASLTTDDTVGSWYVKESVANAFEPDENETYRVVIDGTPYDNIQFTETETSIFYAGNADAFKTSTPASETPDFGIRIYWDSENDTWPLDFCSLTDGTHSVKIQKTRSSDASGANFSFYPCDSETEVSDGVPNVSSPDGSHIYLVANSGDAPNSYDEFIYVWKGESFVYEKIGTTDVNLSGYVTTETLTNKLPKLIPTAKDSSITGQLNDTTVFLTPEEGTQILVLTPGEAMTPTKLFVLTGTVENPGSNTSYIYSSGNTVQSTQYPAYSILRLTYHKNLNLGGTNYSGWWLDADQTPDLSGYATTSAMNTALAAKQNTLTFDNAPTSSSNNPVKSGGVYSALAKKADVPYKTVINTTSVTTDGDAGNWYIKVVNGGGFDPDTTITYKITVDGTVHEMQFTATGETWAYAATSSDFKIFLMTPDNGTTWNVDYRFLENGTHTVKIEEPDEYIAKSELEALTALEVGTAWSNVFTQGA